MANIRTNWKNGKNNEKWGMAIDSYFRSEKITKNNDCDGDLDEEVEPLSPDYWSQDK